jgi:polyisoprenoid-binding protein YceI
MADTYTIDPAHSSIQFSIRHMMVSNVRGSFTGVKGVIVHDASNPANSRIDAEIEVNTVNTNDSNRDAHLKTAEFFDVEKYPTMKFVSTKVEKTGENEYKATGDLTIHGVTKQVVLTVDEVSAEGKDPWGNIRMGASAKGKINRKDFGLTWTAALETGGVLVGDEVKLEFDIEAIKAQSASA